MNRVLILMMVLLAFLLPANAQAPKMTSVYSNLQTGCKPESKAEGDEVPFICKAVGSFRARITPAGAWAEILEIVDSKGNTVASFGTVGYGYSTTNNRKLEWRMANGKPFAAIFRVNTYNAEKAGEEGENPFLLKYKTGESLLIRGLPGYSQIEFEIDGKEKGANLKAQKMADENFQ